MHKYCDEGGGGASSKEICTSCEQNKNISSSDSSANIDAAVVGINKMSISTISIRLSTCANCGKEGSDSYMNTCNKCNSVKYCNAACKKKHRSKHKKCEKRVAELHDEALFKQPPPREDCPICFIRLPSLWTGYKYMSCCGKIICSGCIYAVALRNGGVGLCPFCRAPMHTTDKQLMKKYEKRSELGDAHAIYDLGCHYDKGNLGCPQNSVKALELWHQAGEMGSNDSYH